MSIVMEQRAESSRLLDAEAADWEKTYAVFLHLSLLLVHVFIPVVPALAMWLIKRNESPLVDDHGKEAVNFQISLVIYAFVSGVLFLACGIGILLMIATYVLGLVGMIMASIAAGRGEYYRYPMCLRFVH